MDRFLVGSEYASHLTDADLGLLASVAAADTGTAADASSLRGDPEALLRLLENPGAFRAVLGAPGEPVPASPFLVFAVSVQRAAAELASAGHVPERTGPRQRVPLFDAPALRDFLAAPARPASSSGSTSVPAGTGPPAIWRRLPPRGSRSSARWPTGSGRPGACSTT
jgi:hypothetical protein